MGVVLKAWYIRSIHIWLLVKVLSVFTAINIQKNVSTFRLECRYFVLCFLPITGIVLKSDNMPTVLALVSRVTMSLEELMCPLYPPCYSWILHPRRFRNFYNVLYYHVFRACVTVD
jgi:hypothetical protein